MSVCAFLSCSPSPCLSLCPICLCVSGIVSRGCRRSQVVTFTAIRLRCPGFKPRPGQQFENENFCLKKISASGAPQRWWRRVTRAGWGQLRHGCIKPDFLSYLLVCLSVSVSLLLYLSISLSVRLSLSHRLWLGQESLIFIPMTSCAYFKCQRATGFWDHAVFFFLRTLPNALRSFWNFR